MIAVDISIEDAYTQVSFVLWGVKSSLISSRPQVMCPHKDLLRNTKNVLAWIYIKKSLQTFYVSFSYVLVANGPNEHRPVPL